MALYNIAICDDMLNDLVHIKNQIELIMTNNKICYEISTFTSSNELIKAVKYLPNRFDMLLLDILLEKDNGVDLAVKLRSDGTRSTIIFITTSPDFAIEGYKVNAFRYLIKPVNQQELSTAILSDIERVSGNREVIFRIESEVKRVRLEDIYYIKTFHRGLEVHLENEMFVAAAGINEVEQTLTPGPLVRCHKSYIININYVNTIKRHEVTIDGYSTIRVGRTYYDKVRKTLMERLAK